MNAAPQVMATCHRCKRPFNVLDPGFWVVHAAAAPAGQVVKLFCSKDCLLFVAFQERRALSNQYESKTTV